LQISLLQILIGSAILGLVAAPAALVAQQADTSQALGAHSDNPLREAHHAEKEEQADETAEYRHSAAVKWLAGALHMGVDPAATLFEYINFAVIVLALGIPLFKILPKVLRKRSETLSEELQSARKATEDANSRLSAVEAKLAGLDAEIEAIRKQVEVDMREDEARIKASIGEESARIIAAAEQEIQVAATSARRELKEFAADLAIEGALSHLTLNEDTDRALIAEFASGFSGSQAGKAGQN
jgi:F-type H+-transporting ATPase subunit b